MYWINNAAHIYVEDGDVFVRGEDVDYVDRTHCDTDSMTRKPEVTVSLLDIARPAKQKGKKKLLLLFNNGSLI